jgi:hypothetical protein
MKVIKKFGLVTIMVTWIGVFCACDDIIDVNIDDISVSQKSGSDDKASDDVSKAFAIAYQEFYTTIPSAFDAVNLANLAEKRGWITDVAKLPAPPEDADSVSYKIVYSDIVRYSELQPEEYQMKEQIQAMTWQAMATGKDDNLMQYLKQNSLEEKYLEICDKKKKKSEDRVPGKSISTTAFTSTSLQDGDVFLKYDSSSSGSSNGSSGGSSSGSNVMNWLVPGKWGHAAYIDIQKRTLNDNHYLLSSSNQTDRYEANPNNVMGRSGYDKVVGYWTTASEVAVCRVNNTTAAKRRASLDYIIAYHMNKPWTPLTTRSANDKFYCSKIVYRGWLSQGYELEPHNNWIPIPVFDHWAYYKIGFIKIWYPVFRTEYIKDMWVTPTDLDVCSATYRIATY